MSNKFSQVLPDACAQCRYAQFTDYNSFGDKRYLCTNPDSPSHRKLRKAEFPCDGGFKHIKMKYYLK